jgi:hypothetical protein
VSPPWTHSGSELLQQADEIIVDAVLGSLLEEPIEQIEQGEGQANVIEIDTTDRTWNTEPDAPADRRGE